MKSFTTLVLADVGPSRLNVGYRSLIDCLYVFNRQVRDHTAVKESALELFGFDLSKDLLTKQPNLLLKFWSQL